MAGKVAGDGVPCLDEQAMLDVDVGKQAVLDLDETAVWEPRDQTRQEKTVVDQARPGKAGPDEGGAASGSWKDMAAAGSGSGGADGGADGWTGSEPPKETGGWSNPLGPPVETEDRWTDQLGPGVCSKKCCKSWWSTLGNQERPESRHCSHLSTAH